MLMAEKINPSFFVNFLVGVWKLNGTVYGTINIHKMVCFSASLIVGEFLAKILFV